MDDLVFSNEELRRLRAVQIEVLLEISSVCDKLGIQFFLDGGTLLGAARHSGFIPWDDDVDIGMMREDYEKFLTEAPSLLHDCYVLQTYTEDARINVSFVKVRKKGTCFIDESCSLPSSEQGIWVDIFPFDTVDSSQESIGVQRKKWQRRHKLLVLRSSPLTGRLSNGVTITVVKRVLHACLSAIPVSYFAKALDSIAIPPRNDNPSITSFHYFTVFLDLPKNEAFPLTTLMFEGYRMPVFANWESYLEKVYGDWKQLPPVEKRKGHGIVAIDFGDD